MDRELKKELITSLSQNYGYEKAIEIIEATEYVNELNDEKVNTLLEFFYVANNNLIAENTDLKNKINFLLTSKQKIQKSFKTIFSFVIIILSLILLIIKK